MLRTNSKQAKQNIKNYIIANFDASNYSPKYDYIEEAEKMNNEGIYPEKDIFSMVKHAINLEFYNEMICHNLMYKNGKATQQQLFIEWCQGLPSILDTCYYYNRSAIDDLGNILEQTQTERNKYTEEQAENMLTRLIFRELNK